MLYFLVLIFIILAWIWKTRRRNEEPPALPGAWPLIGHAYLLVANPVKLWHTFMNLSEECLKRGHAIYFLIGMKKFYVLTDPDDINTVSNICLEKDKIFGGMMKRLLGDGLLFAPVSIWRYHRKIILPAFNQQVLESFLPQFNAQARELVNELEKKCGAGPFDSTIYLRKMTLQTIFLTAMGTEMNDVEASNYLKALDTQCEISVKRFQKFWLASDLIYNLTKLKKEEDLSLKALHEMSTLVLSRQRRVLESREKSNGKNNKEGKNNFLEQLLYFSDELSEKEIIDEVHTMILAGSDTSASVLLYALILIGSYPAVQQKIQSELKDIFDDSDRDVQRSDLPQMTYLEAVLKESMRYYVMAPFLTRHIDREIKLKNCTLQPGNDCFFLLYGVHRHEMWGNDADQFRPERWLEKELPSNPNAFMPFSVGKRNCIGRSYAMMSIKTTLSHLLRSYTIHADHSKMKVKIDMLMKPASNYYISIESNKN